MATEPLQLNLGSLRSAMSLTLHTHHASRIWHGRAPADGRPGIVGLNGFVSVMNKMKRGSEQDDPYSDWWMLRIEEKLEQTKAALQTLREQVDQVLADVPPALSIGENHTALIDRSTLERWLNEGAHALRSLFSLAQQYRYSGCTREDFAAKNAAARMALEKFGELPAEVMVGSLRSRFAPPIARRGGGTGADVAAAPDAAAQAPAPPAKADDAPAPEGDDAARAPHPPPAPARASRRWNRRTSGNWNMRAT